MLSVNTQKMLVKHDQRHKLTLSTRSGIVILNARLYTMVGPTTNFFSNYFGVPWIFIVKVR